MYFEVFAKSGGLFGWAPCAVRRHRRATGLSPMYRQPDYGYAQPSGGPSSSAEPCVCIDVPPDANPHLDRRRRRWLSKVGHGGCAAPRRAAESCLGLRHGLERVLTRARACAALGRFLVPQGLEAGTQANRVRITDKVTTMHLEDGGGMVLAARQKGKDWLICTTSACAESTVVARVRCHKDGTWTSRQHGQTPPPPPPSLQCRGSAPAHPQGALRL